MLGERLFPLIQQMHPDLAGKITGMLLEIDNTELLHMLESRESLKAKVGLQLIFNPMIIIIFLFLNLKDQSFQSCHDFSLIPN